MAEVDDRKDEGKGRRETRVFGKDRQERGPQIQGQGHAKRGTWRLVWTRDDLNNWMVGSHSDADRHCHWNLAGHQLPKQDILDDQSALRGPGSGLCQCLVLGEEGAGEDRGGSSE